MRGVRPAETDEGIQARESFAGQGSEAVNIGEGADYSEPLGDYPIVECPKCGKSEADMDGFGFIACIPGCGHCTHPSAEQHQPIGLWYCGICGQCLPDSE